MRPRFSITTLFVFVLIAAVAIQFSLVAYRQWLVPRQPIPWVAFTPTVVAAARNDGRVVLLHFSADWDMVTVLAKRRMDVAEVRSAIHRHGVVPILADISHDSPDRDYLKQVSANGSIPLTIVYPVDEAAQPILLEGYVKNADLILALENAVKAHASP